jgi:hypothetical protein
MASRKDHKERKALSMTEVPTCSSVAVKQKPFFLCSGIVESSTSNTLSRTRGDRYDKAESRKHVEERQEGGDWA